MKLKASALLAIFSLALSVPGVALSQEGAERLFQSALYKEEVDGNLTEAIKLYKQVTQKFPKNRQAVAKSLFHLGLCSERLEDKSEAIANYQRILDQYVDQREVVDQAKARLSGLLKEREMSKSKAIAVLPFKNINKDEETEFFSDGFTEDLITKLSQIRELRIISRASTMRYKNTGKSGREIGLELGVGNILDGSLYRVGDRIRISAQLIRSSSDEHLWAESYEKDLRDIFAIQSDVASRIAAALKATFSPAEKAEVYKKPTENIDAYTYYSKAREHYNRFRPEDNENAIILFKKALDIDSSFALSYAGLADAYQQRWERYGFPVAWVDSGIVMALKAVSIDSNLAEAYKALGLNYAAKGWIRKGLDAERKAVSLNPNHYGAISNIGYRLEQLGELAEALTWRKKALELNPVHPIIVTGVAQAYSSLDYDYLALQYVKRALELDSLARGRLLLSVIYMKQGKAEEAMRECKKVLMIDSRSVAALNLSGTLHLAARAHSAARRDFEKLGDIDSTRGSITALAYTYLQLGLKTKGLNLLQQRLMFLLNQLEEGHEANSIPYEIATINAIKDNKSRALQWLQRAIDAGWRNYSFSSIDPLLKNLHDDQRFENMMSQVKATVYREREKVEKMERK